MSRRVVMVVDDEPLTREVLAVILDSEDFEVHTVGSGAEAVRLAQAVRPDVVLLDVMMPGMDGFELCRALRAEPETKAARIVVLSALDDAGAKRDADDAGADAYLVKPYSARELFASLSEGADGP